MIETTPAYRIILTGASGMVGRAVLLECLESSNIAEVVMINRQPVDIRHPKLIEIIHGDFSDIAKLKQQLTAYNGCFYCAGVSSVGKDEAVYSQLTFDLVVGFARTVYGASPAATFNYVSGQGTDSSEGGKVMWARVKGRTENALLNIGFADGYLFRLGAMIPDTEVRSKTGWVNTFVWLLSPSYPLMRRFGWAVTSSEFGQAMINSLKYPQPKKVLENTDIKNLANRNSTG